MVTERKIDVKRERCLVGAGNRQPRVARFGRNVQYRLRNVVILKTGERYNSLHGSRS